MDHFHYRDGQLYCDDLPVSGLAEEYGTPLYVYSQAAIVGALKALQAAFAELEPLVCYSVKANSNLSILKVMAGQGSGFDVVSGGELLRVQKAGGDPGQTVFAGVGKTDEEIAAGLKAGVLMFNVESEAELEAIDRVARPWGRSRRSRCGSTRTSTPRRTATPRRARRNRSSGWTSTARSRLGERIQGNPNVSMIGVHMHIGSQITTVDPYAGASAKAGRR